MEQQPPPPLPPAPHLTAPYALRMMLIRRYSYLTLNFSSPIISESGRWEASWNGGRGTTEDTEAALLARVLEELQDCGAENHSWETASEGAIPSTANA
jgi:hypothetical protein